MNPRSLNESVYWISQASLKQSQTANPFPKKADVAVIGSGYTGMVAAIQLRKAGSDVCVLEKDNLGQGASSRNGGMVLTGLSIGLRKILNKFGRERLGRYYQESVLSIDRVEELVKEGDIDCDFNRCGHLEAAYKPSHYNGLCEEQEFLGRELNHETRLISPDDQQEEIDSQFYCGALLDPLSAGIQPAKYMSGLIRLANQIGVRLFDRTEARSISRHGNSFALTTSQGELRADTIVIASNGYTSGVTPWHRRRVVPVESFMIATEPLASNLRQTLIPKGRMIFDTKRFLYYFRMSPEGDRLLFGARPKHPGKSVAGKAEDMRREMVSVFPQLKAVGIEYAWGGNVGFTSNYLPLVGGGDGIYYALGYCGHGIAMASYFGFELAGMIRGKPSDSIFLENQPSSIPFYHGYPWFLPLVHQWFRFLDRLN